MGYEFEGVVYERLRDMQAARRARYAELLKAGMNFTQAAHAVGVSKRTGKVWRNGRTRSTGRNEGPLVDWYAGRMGPERDRQAGTRRHLSEDERIEIADLVQAGEGVRAIAVLLQCLFSRLISIFPQCGRMVFPGLVIMQSVM